MQRDSDSEAQAPHHTNQKPAFRLAPHFVPFFYHNSLIMSQEGTGEVLKITGDTTPIKLPLPTGPIEGVKYPLKVVYCGECRFVYIAI